MVNVLNRFKGDVLVNGRRFGSDVFNKAAKKSNLWYSNQGGSSDLLLSGLRGRRNVFLNGYSDGAVNFNRQSYNPGYFGDIQVGDAL